MSKKGYFESRAAVGKLFAEQLEHLKDENTAILAVSPGGAVIGVEIAKQLDLSIGLLSIKKIYIPGDTTLGIITEAGLLTYDQSITASQIEEFNLEYRNSIEASKMDALHNLHVLSGAGELSAHDFSNKNVILVSDLSRTGTSIKAAMDFLKPVHTNKIIITVPVAMELARDVIHHYGDQVICLHVTDKDFGSNHYFTENVIPTSSELALLLKQASQKIVEL